MKFMSSKHETEGANVLLCKNIETFIIQRELFCVRKHCFRNHLRSCCISNSADYKKISSERLLVDCKDQDEDQSVVIMLEEEESKLLFTEKNTENLVRKPFPIFLAAKMQLYKT